MTTCRFLFNDYFRPDLDGQTGAWGIGLQQGNARAPDKLLHTFRNGQLFNSESFTWNGTDEELLIITDNVPFELCDTAALINTNLIGGTLSVGQSEREIIAGANALVKSPNDSGAANVFVDSGVGARSGKISLVYIGCAHDFVAYYPTGWRPPFLREYRVKSAVSENGLPMAIHRTQETPEYTIPLRFLKGREEAVRLENVLYRMQTENFVFQYDTSDARNILYGWATNIGRIEYTSHDLIGADVRIGGYFEYVN